MQYTGIINEQLLQQVAFSEISKCIDTEYKNVTDNNKQQMRKVCVE